MSFIIKRILLIFYIGAIISIEKKLLYDNSNSIQIQTCNPDLLFLAKYVIWSRKKEIIFTGNWQQF